MTRLTAIAAALLLGLAACDDEKDGELGNGAFQYVCVDDSDRICDDGIAGEFPDQVATGSTFALDARALQWWQEEINGSIVPASERFAEFVDDLDVDGYVFRARRQGVVAMMARRASDHAIGDFIHLVIKDIASVRLDCTSDRLTVGAETTCKADPGLAGSLEYEWTTGDPTVLDVEAKAGTAEATLRAVREGETTLRVEVGDVSSEIVVLVKPAPPTEPPALDAGPDTGTDADIDNDAGGDDDAG